MTKTVWITGASSGIGREFARRYAAMGCRLILTARRADRLTALAEELNDAHGTVCRILPADLADRADCDRLCAELAGERIDIFINNAGFGVCGSLLETDSAKEEEMVQVNVAAMRRLFQFMLRRMQAQGGGTILNVASSAGLLPGGPYMAGYYASKAYVVSLTRGAAQALREKRSPVYVCALCPGPVNTEFNDRAGVVFALKGITPEFCVHLGTEAAAHASADAHRSPSAEKEAGLTGKAHKTPAGLLCRLPNACPGQVGRLPKSGHLHEKTCRKARNAVKL